MSYLYLNFYDNLNSGSKSRSDFYTTSLTEQYDVLKRKLGKFAPDTLQEFAERCCPSSVSGIYYISMPAFERSVQSRVRKDGTSGMQFINNVVVRPDLSDRSTRMMSRIPPQFDVILIGDITFGSVISFTVKGIELIDSNVAKYGEYRVACTAACAFIQKTITTRTGTFTAPDYGTSALREPVLTRDFIDRLCTEVYPIPDPQKAFAIFTKWKKYLSFRRYYLGVQSSKCEAITDVIVKPAYMISSAVYKKNKDNFEELLLDGHDVFSHGEQIVLSREVAGADEFPLICVTIEKNRKQILSETIGRGAKGKPKYEVALRRYTRESMGLSPIEPKYDEEGNLPKGFRFSQYLLGERFAFAYTDLEPDCSSLERTYEKDLARAYTEIDTKYHGIIMSDLERFMTAQTPIVQATYDKKLREYIEDLNNTLAKDIAENLDKEVREEYHRTVIAPIESAYASRIKEIQKKIEHAKKGKKKDAEELEAELQALINERDVKIESAKAMCSIASFYEARNAKRIETKKKSLLIAMQGELDSIKKAKKSELERQYKGQIEGEKAAVQAELQRKLKSDIAEKIENETIRRYEIYFRPENPNDTAKELKKDIEKADGKFLTYDNRAEKAKIERQERALASLLGGYVKNPYLASYLFSPETLAQSTRQLSEDISWCLESLNDTQKTAVRRALASDSIFLLQGPPGTGKTQVIAEITAQFAKMGKKILISSETHKAIDNVFERLPKIPEIRPLRLIPSQNGKETNYSPERLVDNFYLNIQESLRRQVDRFEHFNETKETFSVMMKELRLDYDRLLRLKQANVRIDAERRSLIEKINGYNAEIETLRENITTVRDEIETFNRTIKYIESYRFDIEGTKVAFITEYISLVQELLSSFSCFASRKVEDVRAIITADLPEVRAEIASVCGDDRLVLLERKRDELKAQLSAFRDPDTDEVLPENEDEYRKVQKEFIELGKEIKELKTTGVADISDGILTRLVSSDVLANKALLQLLPEQITAFRIKLAELIGSLRDRIEKERVPYIESELSLGERIANKQREINEAKARYEELETSEGVAEYDELNTSLKQKIGRFFRDFGIVREYDSGDLQTAFDIIAEEWNKLEFDYQNSGAENRVKIPMFKDICKYLESEDILEEDRQSYTRLLYDNVNVFGITCTSRDKFTPSQLKELANYGIDSVDIRTQGIDVVIIDEVSKSSFLDLLIPILYGKTVILVGDHRQLPPMYDLRHMREADFEGLDDSIISKEINDSYTALYEECFFKTLYERVPSDFRVMLNKQYRCHSHIMDVFNHFYGGTEKGLTVGKKHQDDEKQHGLTVRIGGNVIIDPDHHIYFIDCDEKESSEDGSTSKINKQEAEVVMELLRAIDTASLELVTRGKLHVEKRIDERPSVGVICTYGDQAGLIKKRRKGQQYKGFSGKSDEKLIISTVDDFQGDERDIIIVSMVRNPKDNRFNAEFVKQFERINVAFSRARKLLIIVGAKKFLSEQTIELPDLTGDRRLDKHNFPVYREIIDTIALRGRLWTAQDIIIGG